MWVKITAGPEWAIGRNAQLVDEVLILWSEYSEPYWYSASEFSWIAIGR